LTKANDGSPGLMGLRVLRVEDPALLRGRGTTAPTEFKTVTQMKKAIEFETYRPVGCENT